MIARLTSCGITSSRSAGFHGWDRRQGDRRQAGPERQRPAESAAPRRAEPQAAASGTRRGPGIPGRGDGFRTEVPMATTTRMTEAARAFSAGNCFLSGTLIDRSI